MLRSRPRPRSASDWIGWRVDDAQGRRVGALAAVYEDDVTCQDAWYLVRLGRFSARYVLVPPADALVVDGRLYLPYRRETIERSPLLYAPPEATTPALEEELHRHYRLTAGRNRELGVLARRHAAQAASDSRYAIDTRRPAPGGSVALAPPVQRRDPQAEERDRAMAVAYVMDFAGGTTEQYDEILERMGLDGQLPEHALFHAAGATDAGIRIVDVWESDEAYQAFAASQIGPNAAAVGVGEPVVQRLAIETVEQASGAVPTFVQLVKLPIDHETFQGLDARVRPGGVAPDGLTHHFNGEVDGSTFVLDGWASKELRDAFMGEHVAPVMAEILPGPPVIEELALHATMVPATA